VHEQPPALIGSPAISAVDRVLHRALAKRPPQRFEDAAEMARATGYPLKESIGYETPGSLGSYAGRDLGIPSITIEIERDATEPDLWPSLAPALEAFLLHPGGGWGS